jgi:hypothetical protein
MEAVMKFDLKALKDLVEYAKAHGAEADADGLVPVIMTRAMAESLLTEFKAEQLKKALAEKKAISDSIQVAPSSEKTGRL